MKLFVIYMGGAHEQALIELHDIRFVVAHSIEDTYEELRKSWWGIPSSLHLDAWGVLHSTDGYKIHFSNEPALSQEHKLYFVNLGGYDVQQFNELHKNIFVVATNEQDAKQKAILQINDWTAAHKDYQFEVDQILNINQAVNNKQIYLHLNACDQHDAFEFTCGYVPIGK